jgi:cobalt-zinc-cadmium efflux system protein
MASDDAHSHHHHGHGAGQHLGHDHHGAHDVGAAGHGRAFAIGIVLNLIFVAVELAYGVTANSVALLADAGHNLSDVLALAVAWGAAVLGRRPAGGRFTYGLRGSSILAALFNALALFVACGAIASEAVQRLIRPMPVIGRDVIIVAAAGIVVNLATAMLFVRGRHGDLNIRSAFVHMTADAAVSAGVVVAGVLIVLTGVHWIDPLASLLVVVLILWSSWGLLRDAIALSLQAVPRGIDVDAVSAHLASLPGVTRVHHVHIWAMSTTETALTAHLVMPQVPGGDAFLAQAAENLARRFGIDHATLQIENGEDCASPCH